MLSPYRVIDLSDDRGLFCSRLLAELGAEVIHVEPPEGSAARHRGPFAGAVADPEHSLTWWAFARGTRSVVLDLDDPVGRERLGALVATADIVVESADPGHWEARGLGYETLSAANPALVWVSITAFGPDGPKANYAATDLIVQAASGAMALTGEGDRPPLRASAVPAWTHAAAEAAGGALIALRGAQRSGRGQRVDVSAQRATNLTSQFTLPAAQLGHRPMQRAGGINVYGVDIPFVWPTLDGHVSLTLAIDPVNKPFLERLLAFMVEEGHGAEGITDRDWVAHLRLIRSGDRPSDDLVPLRDAVAAFLATMTNAELFAAALDRKLLLVPVATFDDLFTSPQLAHRRFWASEILPDGSTALLADHLVRSTVARPGGRNPAPRIGEHTDEILGPLGDGTDPRRRPGEGPQPRRGSTPDPTPPGDDEPLPAVGGDPRPDLPLAGLKVLDMMWVMAGPYSTGVLAQYGATVVRVENEARLDTGRLLVPWYEGKVGKERSFGFASINADKLSVTVDPNTSEGRDVIRDLVRWADVVTESFSPRAMTGWGLDYESLRRIRPDLIMISSCLMGQDGPHAYVAGYGTMGSAAAGLVQPTGWPDRKPNGPYGAYTDYCAPRISVAAILAAVDHRHRTGEGQYLDQSQIESTLAYAMPALLDHQVNGTTWDRLANTDPEFTPHGVYRAEGDDAWVAIACRHDDDWQRLATVVGRPDLAGLDAADRRSRGDEIDAAVTDWTSTRHPREAEEILQAQGIPAHAVATTALGPDPQLTHLEHQVTVSHPDLGRVPVERTRIELSRTPARPRHFPKLGQHTDEVLESILGYDRNRIDELRRSGALGSGRRDR
ncbi:MAG: CaiB/BaiF CoA transferase family protein [Acidimicrobiales bacterium]